MTQIRYFGKIRERMGLEEETLQIPADLNTAKDVRDWLAEQKADAGVCLLDPSVRIIINNEFADWGAAVSNEDILAFIPPVSGG